MTLTSAEIDLVIEVVERWGPFLDRDEVTVIHDALPPFETYTVAELCQSLNYPPEREARNPVVTERLSPEMAVAWERAKLAGGTMDSERVYRAQDELWALPFSKPFITLFQFSRAQLLFELRAMRERANAEQS